MAIQVLESVLERVPNDPQVLSQLALAYMEKGRHDISTRYLEKAVELTGGTSDLRTRLALSRIGSGDVVRGMSELTKLFDEDPQMNTEAGTALATAYLKHDDARAALRVSERLVEVVPRDLTALNLLASSQLALGRLDDARLT